MLGVVSTPATEGLGGVVFGGLSQLVHIAERAERLREENRLKKQISDLNAEYSDQMNKNKAAATYGHAGGTFTETRVGDALSGRDISKHMGIFELPR